MALIKMNINMAIKKTTQPVQIEVRRPPNLARSYAPPNYTTRPAMALGVFVGFIAACMALNAMSIDIMLPALPLLHAGFKLADPNQAQAVITAFFIKIRFSQLFYAPLGRKPILVTGLGTLIWTPISRPAAENEQGLLSDQCQHYAF